MTSCGIKVDVKPVDVNHKIGLDLEAILEFCNSQFATQEEFDECVTDLTSKINDFLASQDNEEQTDAQTD